MASRAAKDGRCGNFYLTNKKIHGYDEKQRVAAAVRFF
jgi:hypothetical protein